MSNVVRYRIAEASDVEAIGIQGRAAFLETFQEFYSDLEINGYFAATYGTRLQAEEIADAAIRIFIAEDDQGLLGHLKLGPCALPVNSTEPAAEVKRFYLLSRAQGTDIARTLLAQAVETARGQGAKSLYLSCWTANERALRFYLREGFAIVGRQDFHMGPRVDEDYIMQRRI